MHTLTCPYQSPYKAAAAAAYSMLSVLVNALNACRPVDSSSGISSDREREEEVAEVRLHMTGIVDTSITCQIPSCSTLPYYCELLVTHTTDTISRNGLCNR